MHRRHAWAGGMILGILGLLLTASPASAVITALTKLSGVLKDSKYIFTARVESLDVLPDRSIHRVGEAQQVVVRARYGDGRSEDVTPWVKWSSSDESVCRVDEQGLASVVGPGEGAVVAWYASAAIVVNTMRGGAPTLPVGKALWPARPSV